MEKLKALFNKYKQFLFFCIVGAMNTVVAYVVYALLVFFTGAKEGDWQLTLFSVIGDICGGVNSYFWNRFWVFKKSNATTRESLPRFIVTFLVYLALSTGLFRLVEWIFPSLNKYVIKIIVLPVTMIINFLMNKLWAFRGKKQ